jgi:hypothetical protein
MYKKWFLTHRKPNIICAMKLRHLMIYRKIIVVRPENLSETNKYNPWSKYGVSLALNWVAYVITTAR